MPDHGYPTDEEIQRLKDWPKRDASGLLAYLKTLWWPDGGAWDWSEEQYADGQEIGIEYRLSTGGWSGNEELIAILKHHAPDHELWLWFWSQHWYNHRVGGHYRFRVESTCPHHWVQTLLTVPTGTGSITKPGPVRCTLCQLFQPPIPPLPALARIR